MDSIETIIIGVGRGRGSATNVPERALIELVKTKPLLYDKNAKDYRKPGVSEAAWSEVADALGTTVTNCKKRWKSLRDTFIKYYRLEVNYSIPGATKRKTWSFYDSLSFLKPHVELFRLEDGAKEVNDSTSGFKENFTEPSDYMIEDEEEIKEVYEIKIAEEEFEDDVSYRVKEDHLLESYEEQLESNIDEFELTEPEENVAEKSAEKTSNESFEAYETETEDEEPKVPPTSPGQFKVTEQKVTNAEAPMKDPDETYLMSCLPAFKRFTPQQKAYVRMAVERLFYEVEFENVSEPKSKRSKDS